MTHELLLIAFFLLVTVYYKMNNVNKKTLSISPEMLTSYAGKNWNNVSDRFKNKKDYWCNISNNPATLAGINLHAIDTRAPVLHYNISIRLNL